MNSPWVFSHYWNGVKFLCGMAYDIDGKPGRAPNKGWADIAPEEFRQTDIPRCPECQEVLDQFGGGL